MNDVIGAPPMYAPPLAPVWEEKGFDRPPTSQDPTDLYSATGRVRLYTCHTAGSLKYEFTHTLRLAKDWHAALDDLLAVYEALTAWEGLAPDDYSTVSWALACVREAKFQFGAVLSRNVYKTEAEVDALSEEVVDASYSAARRIEGVVRLVTEWQLHQGERLGPAGLALAHKRPFRDVPFRAVRDLRNDLRGQIVKFRTVLNRAEDAADRLADTARDLWAVPTEICMTSRRAVRLLHCLLALSPTQVRPEMVTELIEQYDRAVLLVPEETAFRRSIERRGKRLRTLFPPPVADFSGYRYDVLNPRPCD